MILELIAALSAGLFTGAAVYINLVEHPARMSLGTAIALAEWAPSYRRATVMQASLAIAGTLAALAAWIAGAGAWWLVGAALLGSVVPFTLIVLLPTNNALLDPTAERDLARADVLLGQWNRLHAVRTVAGGAAFLIFAALLG